MSQSTPLHETLWNQTQDLAEACRIHPFVRGMADATLDSRIFKRYVAQDAFFLRAFARAYELAAEQSQDSGIKNEFLGLRDSVAQELRLHACYAQSLGIDLTQVAPYRATKGYTDFLLETATRGPVDETVAAMTPCMRLYAYLGKELARETGGESRAAHPYRQWIETYEGAEFQTAAACLEALLDRLATDRPAIREAYARAMECEVKFFSAPIEDA